MIITVQIDGVEIAYETDNVGDDEDASKHDFVPTSVYVFQTFYHDMITGNQCKNQKDQQIPVDLHVFNGHTI